MELHKGKLFWPSNTSPVSIRINTNLSDNDQVLVVGSGMSGALAAYELSKSGYRVTLIDQGKIASGSTSANTGLIQYMSDEGVKTFSEQIGEEAAIKFYNQSKEAVADLVKIDKEIINLNQDTFEETDSLILATQKKKVKDVIEEAAMQRDIGYRVEYLDQKQLKNLSINAYGGLRGGKDIALNPYGFVLRLLKTSVERYGLEIVEGVRFISCDKKRSGNLVNLEINGNTIQKTFNKVVIATGYNPPSQFVKGLKNIQIYKTYVAVSQAVKDKGFHNMLVWEVKDPYTYFRKTFDERMMIGGFDEKSKNIKDKDVGKRDKDLVKGANSMLTDKYKLDVEYSYTALFGISKDNLPYMGVYPKNEDVFVICGLGGNGTVYSKIGSTMISKWIKGESLEDYQTYKLGR